MPDLSIEYMRMCEQLEQGSWEVEGSRGDKYEVELYGEQYWSCSCPAFKFNGGRACKHIKEVQNHEQCGWHEQYSQERMKKNSTACPRCGGPTVVVRVAV